MARQGEAGLGGAGRGPARRDKARFFKKGVKMADIITLGKEANIKKGITERHIYTQELIRALKNIEPTKIITYDDLGKIIGMDVRPHAEGYTYQYSARGILEREDQIAFEIIPKIGLRRLTIEEVALGTGSIYQKSKKSLIHRSKRRISTVDGHYDNLSPEAQMRLTIHRTILAFDYQFSKSQKMLRLENKIREDVKLIGFQDMLELFKK